MASAAPAIAYVISSIFPMSDMLLKIVILVAGMPTAANTALYALQFNTKSDLVSGTTFVSTLLSVITLPILLMIVV